VLVRRETLSDIEAVRRTAAQAFTRDRAPACCCGASRLRPRIAQECTPHRPHLPRGPLPQADPLTGHTGTEAAVALGRVPDCDIIVSGSADATVRIWRPLKADAAGADLFVTSRLAKPTNASTRTPWRCCPTRSVLGGLRGQPAGIRSRPGLRVCP